MCKKLPYWIAFWVMSALPAMGNPTIQIAWDTSPQPELGQDYYLDDSDPNYPSVELKTGSLTWRVWSTDPENEGEIGDIGVISCPHPDNFGIKILDPEGGPGARDVLAINLVPSGSGSGSKYSKIVGGKFGKLLGDMTLKATDGSSPTGGDVASLEIDSIDAGMILTIPGTISGTVAIGLVSEAAAVDVGTISSAEALLDISEVLEGATVEIGKIVGQLSVYKLYPSTATTISFIDTTGSVDIEKMEDSSNLFLSNTYCNYGYPGSAVHIADMYGSSVVDVRCPISMENLELPCNCSSSIPYLAVTVDAMHDNSQVYYPQGPKQHESLEVGSMSGTASIVGGNHAGIITLLNGIPSGCSVDLQSTANASQIDLNDSAVNGTLTVHYTFDGAINNGGDVGGTVALSQQTSDPYGINYFHGGATFANVSGLVTLGPITTGVLRLTDSLSGTVTSAGNCTGWVYLDGGIVTTGALEVQGNLSGAITVGKDIESGSGIEIAGDLTGTGSIVVDGGSAGLIHIAQTMGTQTLVKVTGGLDSGAMIDVNTGGDSTSSTGGTIWIGGSATQNPLPQVTMLGAVRVNCAESPGIFEGTVKVVGCAASASQPADICIFGTIWSLTPIKYIKTGCTNQFVTNCTTGCSS